MNTTRRTFLSLLSASAVASASPLAHAGEGAGGWSPEARAEVAYDFFLKMKREIAARSKRLTDMGVSPPDTSLPFLETDLPGGKEEAQWLRYRAGKMGNAQTTSWTRQGLEQLEAVRQRLEEEEKKAKPLWDAKFNGNNPNAVIPPEMKEMIYEIEVQARKLAVILDTSPSMSRMLPLVREVIIQRFPSARFLEVDGCELRTQNPRWGLHGEWYYATPLEERNPFDPKWFLPAIPQSDMHYHLVGWQRNTLAAMRSMAALMEVDAIYWFCDFDDDIDGDAVEELDEILTKSGTRLYVHSVGKKAPARVMALVKKTGGLFTKATPEWPATEPVDPATLPEMALSPETAMANLNKIVKISTSVQSAVIKKDAGTVEVIPETPGCIIEIAETYAKQAAKTRLDKAFLRGRKFTAIGRLVSINGNVPRLLVTHAGRGKFRFDSDK